MNNIFDGSTIVLDGGLGTTLEDVVGSTIVSNSPLWSGQPIAVAPQEIVTAHKMFLQAGANIISTSSYQCSLQTLERAGFNEQEAKSLMAQSVYLARDAVRQFQEEGSPTQKSYVALSLGPLGATLKPTQEFGGYYPPPYGPRAFHEGGLNTNTFDGEIDEERNSIDALARFHFERLAIFATDDNVWDSIDCLAFETVPLQREVIAIRKAMCWLNKRILSVRAKPLKPWWISCIFSGGKSPDESLVGNPESQVQAFVQAAFNADVGETSIVPSAFGFNCTAVEHISPLALTLRECFKDLEWHPWIVLYPNGHASYDESTREWKGRHEDRETQWAEDVSEVVRRLVEVEKQEHKLLGGIIVGGCCKTGPADISHLQKRVLSDHIHADPAHS